VSPYDVIKGGAHTVSAGRGRHRLRATLVVAETALAMILLVGAGLLIRSLSRIQDVSPGFEPRGVVAAGISLPEARYKEPERRVAFYQALLERLAGAPGFRDVALATPLPFTGNDSSASFQIEGQPIGPGDPGPHGRTRLATPGYFAALGIPVKRGRTFTLDDRQGTEPVAVVDENLARQYWPNRDPIGRRIRRGDRAPWMTIVGIVGHVSHNELVGDSDKGTYYQSLLQQPVLGAWVVARMRQGLAEQPLAIGEAVRSVDPALPVNRAGAMSEMVWRSLAPRRFVVEVLAFFAGVALLMAALGLYGVISYSVSQRTQEIGIRMALGADRQTVLGQVLGQGFMLAVIGGVAGVAGSAAASRILASQLYNLSPFDPLTFILTAVVLLAAALAASYFPARAATRVDPLVALRIE
jgi:predicted permease